VEQTDALDMPAERFARVRRQQRNPILVAFAAPHDDVIGLEVDILHTQPGAFKQPKARPVEQARHELRRAAETGEDGAHLRPREHDRQAVRTAGAHEVVEPRKLDAKDLAIQEQQCTERLVCVEALTFASTAR
jgi:hypothetical protein